jgi:hypothetical protein
MNAPEFFHLVREMREAQNRYFAKRDNLDQCKGLERRVDQELKVLLGEPQLFGQLPQTNPETHDCSHGGPPR